MDCRLPPARAKSLLFSPSRPRARLRNQIAFCPVPPMNYDHPSSISSPWAANWPRPSTPAPQNSTSQTSPSRRTLGHPQRAFRPCTSPAPTAKAPPRPCWSILRAAGLRTGLYTSPHLVRINERIRIGEAEICDADFAATFTRMHAVIEELLASGTLARTPPISNASPPWPSTISRARRSICGHRSRHGRPPRFHQHRCSRSRRHHPD